MEPTEEESRRYVRDDCFRGLTNILMYGTIIVGVIMAGYDMWKKNLVDQSHAGSRRGNDALPLVVDNSKDMPPAKRDANGR
jgi:hypothetical protein